MARESSQTQLLTIGLTVIILLGIFVLVEWTRPRVGTIVLPGGTTYLGPGH